MLYLKSTSNNHLKSTVENNLKSTVRTIFPYVTFFIAGSKLRLDRIYMLQHFRAFSFMLSYSGFDLALHHDSLISQREGKQDFVTEEKFCK